MDQIKIGYQLPYQKIPPMYSSYHFSEKLNKKISFLKGLIRKTNSIHFVQLIAKLIAIVRPLIHCISLKIYKSTSYQPILINMILDISWLCLQLASKGVYLFYDKVF